MLKMFSYLGDKMYKSEGSEYLLGSVKLRDISLFLLPKKTFSA